jgi:HEAT repeat protein
MAAGILRYAPLTRAAVDDLQYALLDSDRTVRATSMRSLQALALRAAADPDLGIRIELTWFIELLNSMDWYDRDQAATALVSLTQARDQGALDFMRDRALAALIDMARWKTPAHAHAAFVLVGRIAGLTEKGIQDAWSRGDREGAIKQALKSPR